MCVFEVDGHTREVRSCYSSCCFLAFSPSGTLPPPLTSPFPQCFLPFPRCLSPGKIIVSPGGTCTKPDGSTDVYLVCVNTHPICYKPAPNQPGKCSTYAESQAGSPPSSGACTQFAPLGQYCNVANGQCCGGAPKNAKCESNKCVTTYPTSAPAPTPGPSQVACASFANLGEYCNAASGQCCGGGAKNAKCEKNNKCVTTYPTSGGPGPVGVTPAGRR